MKKRSLRRRISHDRWLVSYADFITLLFAFFVVLYASAKAGEKKEAAISASIANAFRTMALPDSFAAVQTEVAAKSASRSADADVATSRDAADFPFAPADQNDLQDLRQRLEGQLSPQLQSHVVAMQMTTEGLVISLREAGFFDSASAVPKRDSGRILREIATALAENRLAIRVEGHTDNVPIHNSAFESNWELSSARATRIARILVEEDAIAPNRVFAGGYAGFHPVATNATSEGRAANRRVDLVILPHILLDHSPPDTSSKETWRRVTDN